MVEADSLQIADEIKCHFHKDYCLRKLLWLFNLFNSFYKTLFIKEILIKYCHWAFDSPISSLHYPWLNFSQRPAILTEVFVVFIILSLQICG
jgi:hypothetical protein